MKAKHIISIVVGIILSVGGLVLLIARRDIAVELIGQQQILKEALWGGSSLRDALSGITIGGIVALIIGFLFLIFGIIYATRTKTQQL